MTGQKPFPVKTMDSVLGVSSVGGCILSFFTNQIIFLTAPLTITLTYGLFIQRRILLHNHRIETQEAIHKVLNEYKRENNQSENQDEITPLIQRLAHFTKRVVVDNRAALETRVEDKVTALDSSIREQLQGARLTYEYFLISTRTQSRYELFKALREARHRMIMISPWLTKSAINNDVIAEFRTILEQGTKIEIGWGNLGNLSRKKATAENIYRQRPRWYNALPDLQQLEKEYPTLFKLKCLGTHEKMWICDFNKTYFGSHNFLTSGCRSTEREIGVISTDPSLIRNLISIFDDTDEFRQLPLDFFNNNSVDDSNNDDDDDPQQSLF